MTRTSEILYHNLFASLRNEYFGASEQLIPLSPYKQTQVQQLLDKALEAEPYSSSQHYKFVGSFQEKRRERVFNDERHAIDTSVETLSLLNLIIYNVRAIQTTGISVSGVIAIGDYLRKQGHLVDYVKLDLWLSRLHIQRMASFLSSLLKQCFGFEADELPFLYKENADARKQLLRQLMSGGNKSGKPGLGVLFNLSPLGTLGIWQQKAKHALESIEE